MTNWPTAPFIRIIRGKVDGDEIADELAAHRGNGEYVLFSAKHWHWTVAANCYDDSIDKWEEVTAVPTARLKALKEAWWGPGGENTKWLRNVEDAMTPILDCLPADKPSAIDRAVTTVKDIAGDLLVDAETLPADRLSLLMDALASVQSTARKDIPLAMVARICVDWVQADKEEVVAVEQMRSRARSIPEVIGSDPAKFLVLAGIVGETASMLGDGHPSVSGELINAGTYALAWAAQIIEEEDK